MIYLQLYFLAGVLHDPPYTEGGSEMPYREERETRRLGEPSRFVFYAQKGFLLEGAGLPLRGKTEGVLSDVQDMHQIYSKAYLFACCSFRHGLRRATFLLRFAGYELVAFLPSQSFAPQMPALPKGEPRRRP